VDAAAAHAEPCCLIDRCGLTRSQSMRLFTHLLMLRLVHSAASATTLRSAHPWLRFQCLPKPRTCGLTDRATPASRHTGRRSNVRPVSTASATARSSPVLAAAMTEALPGEWVSPITSELITSAVRLPLFWARLPFAWLAQCATSWWTAAQP
jgi:hypothetical protein